MKSPGQVVVFRFPQTDQSEGKLRPALLISSVPGPFDDWLVCMITSQLRHLVEGFDEVIGPNDGDFGDSGLKAKSLIRIGRLAVVDGSVLLGAIGEISHYRFERVKRRIVDWVLGEPVV
ncbi:MAG: type II toxin-antitoxin system PemK/MazF family toxin [Rhodothermales bacterium]